MDNEEFLAAMIVHRQAVDLAKASGGPRPRVSEYIGGCLLKIATHLSFKNNFVGYSYRDEMVSDGLENCIQYIHNFDPEKSKNPFAYFTQIIYFAFLRRILKEKTQSIIKNEIIQNRPYDTFELHSHDLDGSYSNTYSEFLYSHQEDKPQKEQKIKKKSKKNLEVFMDETV